MEVEGAQPEERVYEAICELETPTREELNRAATYMRGVGAGKMKVPSPALVAKYSDLLLKYPRKPRRCIDKAQRCDYCLQRMKRQKASTYIYRVERGECLNPKPELLAKYRELVASPPTLPCTECPDACEVLECQL
jgi:hypothetical protein